MNVRIRFLLSFDDQTHTHMLVGWLFVIMFQYGGCQDLTEKGLTTNSVHSYLELFKQMWWFCCDTEYVWFFHSTKCFCASSARETRGCRSVSQSRATMKVSESSIPTCSLKSFPGRLREHWPRHIPLMFALVRVSSSVQSLLLWQHLHNHPCLRGCLRQGVNRGPGREAGLSGGPAAGQPRLGGRWERQLRHTQLERKLLLTNEQLIKWEIRFRLLRVQWEWRAAQSHVGGCCLLSWCSAEILDDASHLSKTASAAPWLCNWLETMTAGPESHRNTTGLNRTYFI